MIKALRTVGRYFMLMGRTFSRPERMRMFFRQYLNELEQLGVNSIGIVLLISFFIGAVITIQIKLNIESPWMPRWTVGYVTREIMLLEFSSSIMCLILAGKVGSNIASELGTMRVTQQIDALEIMGINSANYLILPKITAMVTVIPILVTFSIFAGIIGAFCTCWFAGVMNAVDLEYGLQYMFVAWFIWAGIIKSLFFAFIILPKITAMVTVIPILVTFSIFAGIIGAFCTCWFAGVMNAVDLEYGLQYMFVEWFIWAGIIKSLFFAFIIASVSAFFGYTVDGGSIAVGKASTDAVVSSSVLILFADLILTKLLMG